jgi:endonuclease YncB( thermonuclease family)
VIVTVPPTRYTYRANYKRNYDGDTITFDIDAGFSLWIKDAVIRLLGVDCAEMRGENKNAGIAAQTFVQLQLMTAKEIRLSTVKDEKKDSFGRYLADVYYLDENSNWNWLNHRIVESNLGTWRKK